jgi:hypothetical protein
MSTGGSHARRTKYSNAEQSVFKSKRPVILASIGDIVKAGDLADRVVRFEAPTLTERKREKVLDADFADIHGRALGLLLDGAVAALKNQDSVVIDEPLPRLLDFATWCVAAETALGLDAGAFMVAYRTNLGETAAVQLDTPLGKQILALGDFEGTATELSDRFKASEDPDTKAAWTGLTNPQLKARIAELRELVPALEDKGVDVEFLPPSGSRRVITIKRRPPK